MVLFVAMISFYSVMAFYILKYISKFVTAIAILLIVFAPEVG